MVIRLLIKTVRLSQKEVKLLKQIDDSGLIINNGFFEKLLQMKNLIVPNFLYGYFDLTEDGKNALKQINKREDKFANYFN